MSKSFDFADNRRVNNIIWAGAQAYDFIPDFAGYDLIGQPDFYMNLIIGCAYFRYGRKNIEELFNIWKDSRRLTFLDHLTWFGLECAIYPDESKERPSLKELRKDSARTFLNPKFDLQRRKFALQDYLLFELKRAQSLEVLDMTQASMSKKTRIFYEAFRFENTPDFNEFRDLLIDLYQTHFNLSDKDYKLSAFNRLSLSFWQKLNKPLIYRFNITTKLQKPGIAMGKAENQNISTPWFSFIKRSDERLRERFTYEFGPLFFDEAEHLSIESKLACDQHKGSRLWICNQRKDYPKGKKNAVYLELADQQKKRTFQIYRQRKAFYRQSIQRLSNYLELMLTTDLAHGYNPSRYGNLDGRLAFRSKIPGQDKIFNRYAEIPSAVQSVDLMLDASASRLGQIEDIAIQTYILAESLERCTIPVRIVAYCTLHQYTILTILKDFMDPIDLKKIFSYHALGWNRDGLAYSAMEVLLSKRPYYNHLILILTDATPNDLRPLYSSWKLSQPYSGKQGLMDAVKGLDMLRKPGIKIGALISGMKESHENIHKLFGNNYERLNDTGQLVSKAKKLISLSI